MNDAANGGGDEWPQMGGHVEPKNIPVHRAERQPEPGGEAVEPRRLKAVGDDNLTGCDGGCCCGTATVRVVTAVHAVIALQGNANNVPGRGAQQSRHRLQDKNLVRPAVISGPLGQGALQFTREPARIHLVVIVDLERAGELRAQQRL